MPIVPTNAALHQALTDYILANGRSKAAVAAEFGMSPMTIGRFLKSGKVIDANRRKLEAGLVRQGRWPKVVAESSEISSFLVDYDKVIEALEFLLAAARRHAKGRSGI